MTQQHSSFSFLVDSTMKKLTWLIILIALIVAAGVGVYVMLSTPSPFSFTQVQKVSASSPLRLAFPEEMNHASVEERLQLPAGLVAEKTWEGNVLVLHPAGKLSAGKTYVIALDRTTKKADDTPLFRDLKYTFIVAGAPVVSAVVPPSNTRNTPVDARIDIVFDRPMVPLAQVQGGAATPSFADWPVQIKPELKGRWHWVGTTTAEFVPEKGLKLATKYDVVVPPGIAALSGEKTEKDFSWSFMTTRPIVTATDPAEGNADSGPTTALTFSFNHEMDLISARESIVLTEASLRSGSGAVGPLEIGSVNYAVRKDRDGKTETDKRSLVIKPKKPLAFESSYTATVNAGIRGLEGTLGSESGFVLHFSTVGDLTVTGGDREYGRVFVRFSNPLNDATIKGNIVFDPPVTGIDDSAWATQDWTDHKTVEVYPSLLPSTKYTVTVKQGVKDVYGQKLAKPFTFTFTTDPVDPDVFLYPRDREFSIFERGKPPLYFVNNVNLRSLKAEIGAVSFEKFLSVRNARRDAPKTPLDVQSLSTEYRSIDLQPSAKRDLWLSKTLDVEKEWGAPLKPGIYLVSVTSGAPYAVATTNRADRARWDDRFFAVTNLGVTLKYSGNKALVWVTDLTTGKPVEGALVTLNSLTGTKPVVSGTTDAQGFYEVAVNIRQFKSRNYDWRPEFWVTVTKGDDFTFVGSDWNNGLEPYSFDGLNADFRSPETENKRLFAYLYTDRPLYRAGDTVHFKGIVRGLDWNGKFSSPAGKKVNIRITDANNTEIYAKDATVSAFGTFSGSLPVATGASLGDYGMSARMLDDADFGSQSAYGSFAVLAYRKPEYKVTVTPEQEELYNGDTVKATINGAYYFGAPMDSANVKWRVMTSDYYFNKVTDGWYSFALEDAWCWWNCAGNVSQVTEGEGMLSDSGILQVSFPASIDDKGVSQAMSIEADITDKNNQVVSSRGELIVHKSGLYVGIAPEEYVATAGSDARVKIITVHPDGSPAPGTSVELKLYSRVWNSVREKGVDGEYYYDNKPVDTFVRSLSAATSSDGKAVVPVPLGKGGQYRVVAIVKDDAGRAAQAGTSLYAWEDTYVNWPRTNNDRMDIVADKPSYKVGDTAKLLVKTPYQGKGVKALVTIERESIISKSVMDVTSNALPVEVKITEDLVPTAYVSVVVMKPRIGETFDDNGVDTGAPAFKIGYVKLPIDTSGKKLSVKILTDKLRYLPRDKVTVKVETVDHQGNPAAAEVSLAVVDMSLLDLAGFSVPNLVDVFYGERGLGVLSANMLTALMERFKPGSKGGGGGEDGATVKRGNFLDTAYWNDRIVTDKNGVASVTFTLPDNLTTWHFLGLGVTKDHLVGAGAATAIETKNVIVRPVRPRFAVRGDQVTLAAVVHNYLETEQEFTVALTGKGFTFLGKKETTVTVPKDGDTKVSFPVRVGDVDEMTMEFSAVGGNARDVVEEKIPVFIFGVPQAQATAGVTETAVREQVGVPTSKDASTGSLTVSLSPSLGVYLPTGLDYLLRYPYGCAEQTVSRFLPLVALSRLQEFKAFSIVDKATLEQYVVSALQSLYRFQRSDGGFGYWEGSAYSHPVLTTYVLSALKVASDAGYRVDNGVRARAAAYLDREVRASFESVPDPGSGNYFRWNSLEYPSFRAQALFVLSEEGKSDTALQNKLFDQRATLPIFAKAYLAMAFKNAGSRTAVSRAEALVDEVVASAHIDDRGAAFSENDNALLRSFMNTDDRTNAIALQSLVRIKPDHPLLPKLVRGMLYARRNGRWDTTQSTALSILSFVEFLKSTNELEYSFDAGVQLGGKEVLRYAFKKTDPLTLQSVSLPLDSLARGSVLDANIVKEGTGRLYYDLLMQYFYTPDTVEPVEEGIGILREVKPLTKGLNGLKLGETYKVRLTVTVPETRHFVAVESPLPAGMEAIDLSLNTSQQNLLSGEIENAPRSYWDWSYFTHTEFRDDRVFLFADDLPAGIYTYEYLERATTPGKFRERPATAFEMYNPETFGQTGGGWVTIGE